MSRVTYFILNVITIEDFGEGCSQILTIMLSWQFLKGKNLTLQLPFVRLKVIDIFPGIVY